MKTITTIAALLAATASPAIAYYGQSQDSFDQQEEMRSLQRRDMLNLRNQMLDEMDRQRYELQLQMQRGN